MSQSLDTVVNNIVGMEVQRGPVDIYRVASVIHSYHPELTVNEIAEIVTESVVRFRGNAEWKSNPLYG